MSQLCIILAAFNCLTWKSAGTHAAGTHAAACSKWPLKELQTWHLQIWQIHVIKTVKLWIFHISAVGLLWFLIVCLPPHTHTLGRLLLNNDTWCLNEIYCVNKGEIIKQTWLIFINHSARGWSLLSAFLFLIRGSDLLLADWLNSVLWKPSYSNQTLHPLISGKED